MTPELELLFETSIDRVAKNISSIYTADDVIIILKTLRHSIDELPKGVNYGHEEIVRAFNDILDEYSFDEFVSCEPELQGSYGDSYSLEMNTSFDDREFRRCMVNDLQNYFAPNETE
jgi:hypothetical protein